MPKRISETAFASQVEDLFRRFGWKFMHIKPAMTGKGAWVSRTNEEGKGWLDYLAIRPPRIVVCELKDAYGKMTPEQEEWFKAWEECQHTIVVEPMKLSGTTAIMRLHANIPTLTTPEVYLFRPADIDRVIEILR